MSFDLIQLPIVDSELKKAAGEETQMEDERGRKNQNILPWLLTLFSLSLSLSLSRPAHLHLLLLLLHQGDSSWDLRHSECLHCHGNQESGENVSKIFYLPTHFQPPLSPSPPLRGYLLEGQFFIAAALASTLTKLTVRYLSQVSETKSRNVSMGYGV